MEKISFSFNNSTMDNTTQLTLEEIQHYRQQFKDYPEALDALNLIAECDGNLDDALILIYMEETGAEPDRGLDLDHCHLLWKKDNLGEVIALHQN